MNQNLSTYFNLRVEVKKNFSKHPRGRNQAMSKNDKLKYIKCVWSEGLPGGAGDLFFHLQPSWGVDKACEEPYESDFRN